jgi:hypothetical protein
VQQIKALMITGGASMRLPGRINLVLQPFYRPYLSTASFSPIPKEYGFRTCPKTTSSLFPIFY